jgi:hypothetical protein
MDGIALAVGHFFMKVLKFMGADVFIEGVEWIGVEEVGYAVSIVVMTLLVLVIYTQRKKAR